MIFFSANVTPSTATQQRVQKLLFPAKSCSGSSGLVENDEVDQQETPTRQLQQQQSTILAFQG
jgi:hypothetical protein